MDLRENRARDAVESGHPITAITINLTRKCTLGCSYCFSGCFNDFENADIDLATAKKAIDWLMDPKTRGDANKVDISFWGGEPLFAWDMLKDLVLYSEEKAKEHAVEVTFGGTTNVTLLTPEKFDFMDDHNVHFLLSIDGTQEHHDKFRKFKNGKGSWELVDRNATDILKRWPNSQVRFSYSPDNLDGIIEDLDYLYNKGFRDIVYSPVSELDWNPERIEKHKEMWVKVGDWYIEKYKIGPIKVKFVEDGCAAVCGNFKGNSSPCGAGRGYIGVDIDGSLWPCHRFAKFEDTREWYEKETCLGHIDYGILNQEWREKFTLWDTQTSMPDKCKECIAHEKSCTGGCWATNFDINGDIALQSDHNCAMELNTIDQAKYILTTLGPDYASRYEREVNNIPQAQGCQCYNTHDNMFGRQKVNPYDQHRCLCNMSTYGTKPKQIVQCSCYNMQNDKGSTLYDSSGVRCTMYKSIPDSQIDEVLSLFRNQRDDLIKVAEVNRKKLEEIVLLDLEIQALGEESKTIKIISEGINDSART